MLTASWSGFQSPLTSPRLFPFSLTFPWPLSNSLTFPGFPGFPDEWPPWISIISETFMQEMLTNWKFKWKDSYFKAVDKLWAFICQLLYLTRHLHNNYQRIIYHHHKFSIQTLVCTPCCWHHRNGCLTMLASYAYTTLSMRVKETIHSKLVPCLSCHPQDKTRQRASRTQVQAPLCPYL